MTNTIPCQRSPVIKCFKSLRNKRGWQAGWSQVSKMDHRAFFIRKIRSFGHLGVSSARPATAQYNRQPQCGRTFTVRHLGGQDVSETTRARSPQRPK